MALVAARLLLFCLPVAAAYCASDEYRPAEFASTTREVMVSFNLLGPSEADFSNLGKGDFTLTEDGQPRPIRFFAKNQDTPLSLAIVLDMSGSQIGVSGANQRRIRQFLYQVIRDGDTVFLVTVQRKVRLVLDEDAPRAEWNDVLAGVAKHLRGRPVWAERFGGSPIHDALVECVERKFRNRAGRKAILLFSDGDDNASRTSASTLIEKLQSANVAVFGLQSPSAMATIVRYFPANMLLRPLIIRNKMREVSQETGGQFYPAAELENRLNDVEQRLQTMFVVSFAPGVAQPDDRYHSIGIACKLPGSQVVHKRGYRYSE
ncbi:MAG: VWA domain-containing protein [Acidobacteriota bacterium]|nr:VWA domain-containing protein [Acidobacteriota bacterium]